MPKKRKYLLDYLDWETYQILKALSVQPLAFTELQKYTSLSKPNFDARLKALISLSIIQEILVDTPESKHKKKKYTLTDFGKYILEKLDEIYKEAEKKQCVSLVWVQKFEWFSWNFMKLRAKVFKFILLIKFIELSIKEKKKIEALYNIAWIFVEFHEVSCIIYMKFHETDDTSFIDRPLHFSRTLFSIFFNFEE